MTVPFEAVPFEVKGWCPGALRPMRSGDGLLVRLRIFAGRLSPDTARAIADLANRFGNGRIDLSQRANLQLRGVTPSSFEPLIAELRQLGLVDADAAAEAVRNVLVEPLVGPIGLGTAQDIEAALARDADLQALPGKFGFLVDEGGLPLVGIGMDIALRRNWGGVYSMGYSLEIPSPGGVASDGVPVPRAADAALALARAFLSLRTDERRMADLTARVGSEAVFGAAGLGRPGLIVRTSVKPNVIGGRSDAAIAGVPFGQLTAAQLSAAADIAADASTEIRLTPFRALLIPAKGETQAASLLAALGRAGFVTDAADPRLAVVACAGSPDCMHGEMPARTDAGALAEVANGLAGAGIRLHVSGCGKGCAHPGAAPVALVGRAGAYDLVIDGRAGDAADVTGLTLAGARKALEALNQRAPRSSAPN